MQYVTLKCKYIEVFLMKKGFDLKQVAAEFTLFLSFNNVPLFNSVALF